jgi:hypothetical protein
MAANQPTTLDLIIARGAWRQQLVTDYEQTARRLQVAYGRSLPRLQNAADALYVRLNGYVEANGENPTVDRVRGWKQYQDLADRVRAEMSDFSRLLENEARVLQENSVQTGIDAAQEMALSTSGSARAVIEAAWLQPDPAAIARTVGYVGGEPFQQAYRGFGENSAQQLGDALLAGIAQGRNPRATANLISSWLVLPLSWADNIARTTQLYSYRTASHATYIANSRILDGWMWWAALDPRTCISCISQHGTVFGFDKSLSDHHRGRCVEVPIVRGATWPQGVQTGAQWFDGLDDGSQREIMGHAMLDAYRNQAVGWGDFSKPYSNPIFGEMTRAASVKELLGAGATRYYSTGR